MDAGLEEWSKGIWASRSRRPRPVTEVLGERILPTLELMGAALAIAVVVGVGVGVTAAFRQYSVFDHAATTFSLLVISIPQFFLGLIFLYVFSVKLRILPTGGMRTLGEPFNLFDHLKHLVMPATILGLGFAGPFVRYTRASVLETIHAEYLVTGRAKGFSERAVAVRHALPNALLPLIAVAGVQLPYLIAGGVVNRDGFPMAGNGPASANGLYTPRLPRVERLCDAAGRLRFRGADPIGDSLRGARPARAREVRELK